MRFACVWQDKRRQPAAMYRACIDPGGVGKTGRAAAPGLVAEDNMAEAAIIGVRPERVGSSIVTKGEELAAVTLNIACAQYLPERATHLAGEGLCRLQCFGEGVHVAGNTAMNDEHAPVRQTQEGHGGGEESIIGIGELGFQRWQEGRILRHLARDAGPFARVDVIALNEGDGEGRGLGKRAQKPHHARRLRPFVDQVTDQDEMIAGLEIEFRDKRLQRREGAVDVSDYGCGQRRNHSGTLNCIMVTKATFN